MSIAETIAGLTADKINTLAKQGIVNRQDLVEWSLIAEKNHLSLWWSVQEFYHLRNGVKFKYWQVVSEPRS